MQKPQRPTLYIFTLPHPQGHVMPVTWKWALEELITIWALNIVIDVRKT